MQPNAPIAAGHQTRLDRVRTYIEKHFAEELSMEKLAALACYSKSHLHHAFRQTFGETLREHIRRIRLEKSVYQLRFRGKASITDVAYACGFSSSQHFARAFKAHFGVPPARLHARPDWGSMALKKKMQNMEGDYGRRYCLPREARSDGTFIKIPAWTESGQGEDASQELEVVDMPSFRVASVRTVAYPGSEQMFTVMQSLFAWAVPKGLFKGGALLLGAMELLPDAQGRITYDASLTVPEGIDPDEESGVRLQYLPAGEYGVYHGRFQTMADVAETWPRLARGLWISSYFPRQRRPAYEIYYNNPAIHPSRTWILDICLPITTLH